MSSYKRSKYHTTRQNVHDAASQTITRILAVSLLGMRCSTTSRYLGKLAQCTTRKQQQHTWLDAAGRTKLGNDVAFSEVPHFYACATTIKPVGSKKTPDPDKTTVDILMIDASTFYTAIKEISERFGDEWTLHDDANIPENAYISKTFKARDALAGLLTFEYHIIYNISYSVPVLFFNAYKTDGTPVTNLEDCKQLLNIPNNQSKHMLMQQEHPRLHVPFLTFHPCKTSEIMEAFTDKTKNAVVSWISAMGQHVHLNIPVAYSELTFKK